MKISLVALLGLAAFAGNYGADARAIPNELELAKRGPPAPAPVVPKPPTLPKPPTIPRPEPVTPGGEPGPVVPEPVIPEPVAPPGAPKPPTAPQPIQPKPPVVPGCGKLKRWERLIGRACTPPPTADPVPSVEDIKTQINNPTGKSLFYSGPGDKPGEGYIKKANDWINKQLKGTNDATKGYKKLDQSWTDSSYPDKYQINQPPEVASSFNDRASIGFAQKAKGVVYVLLPADTTGTDWNPDTVWAMKEWKELQLNKDVTKVIRVNPENDNEEVILDRTGAAA